VDSRSVTLPVKSSGERKRRAEARIRIVWSSSAAATVGRVHVLRAGRHLIGRDPGDAGITLASDPCASRAHAALEVSERGVTVEDLRSRNGTFVDGARLPAGERRFLDEGVVLRVGETLLVVRFGEDEEDADVPELIGDAPGIRRLRRQLAQVGPDRATVLLIGETGTGKEVAASALHRLSGRKGARIAVNMSAIPGELAESQLFGHLAGAFTGAKAQPGFFRAAHGGTFFLDEIGELPLPIQPKLLRALEDHAVIPVGATEPVAVDVRFVAATNRDLEAAAGAGEFREDLYSRLSDIIMTLPPLRERREDILKLLAHASGGTLPELPAEVAELLVCYRWPRNVREVFKIASHIRLLGPDDSLRERLRAAEEPIDDELDEPAKGRSTRPQRLAAPDRAELEALMERHGGVLQDVAEALGCSRRHLGRWLDQHGIDRERFRRG
jgi:DNA-binding NtrC family response regulator